MADAGIDAVHWSHVGDPRAPDSLLVSYALANGLVVLTQDLDFGALLAASGDSGPSVVQIRAGDTSPESIQQQVISALEQLSDEIEVGAVKNLSLASRGLNASLPQSFDHWEQNAFAEQCEAS